MKTLVDKKSRNDSGRSGYAFALFPIYDAAN